VRRRENDNDKTRGLASESTTFAIFTDARFRCCFGRGHPSQVRLGSTYCEERATFSNPFGECHWQIGTPLCLFQSVVIPLVLSSWIRYELTVSASRKRLILAIRPRNLIRSRRSSQGSPLPTVIVDENMLTPHSFVEISHSGSEIGFQTKKTEVHRKPRERPDKGTKLGRQDERSRGFDRVFRSIR
jgi:hypothetical protein